MIFLSLIYDYIIMGNLTVSEENNSEIDVSSVHLTGAKGRKEPGASLSYGFYNHMQIMLSSGGSIQLFSLEYL